MSVVSDANAANGSTNSPNKLLGDAPDARRCMMRAWYSQHCMRRSGRAGQFLRCGTHFSNTARTLVSLVGASLFVLLAESSAQSTILGLVIPHGGSRGIGGISPGGVL